MHSPLTFLQSSLFCFCDIISELQWNRILFHSNIGCAYPCLWILYHIFAQTFYKVSLTVIISIHIISKGKILNKMPNSFGLNLGKISKIPLKKLALVRINLDRIFYTKAEVFLLVNNKLLIIFVRKKS